jgi:hypothetical protein
MGSLLSHFLGKPLIFLNSRTPLGSANSKKSSAGAFHARFSISVREIMSDTLLYLMNLTVILSFGFPAVPWFTGARWGRRGIWLGTGCVVVILCLFTPLFFAACVAANCGQGAIAIFVLGPIWIGSGLFTLISAAFAYYKFVR